MLWGVCSGRLSCAGMYLWLYDGKPHIVLETSNAGNLDLQDSCGLHHDNNLNSYGSSYQSERLCVICAHSCNRSFYYSYCVNYHYNSFYYQLRAIIRKLRLGVFL